MMLAQLGCFLQKYQEQTVPFFLRIKAVQALEPNS
ncbi:MAG: hypothetical protein ACI9T7_002683 [Oleiphilaceae bacterium]|jgi:hypothetical protein